MTCPARLCVAFDPLSFCRDGAWVEMLRGTPVRGSRQIVCFVSTCTATRRAVDVYVTWPARPRPRAPRPPAPRTRRPAAQRREGRLRLLYMDCHSLATQTTDWAHDSTPGLSGQCTRSFANPTRRHSFAEVSPMHTAVAAVPTRSAHARTAEGDAKVTI